MYNDSAFDWFLVRLLTYQISFNMEKKWFVNAVEFYMQES